MSDEDEMRSEFIEKVLAASGKAKRADAGARRGARTRALKPLPATGKKALTIWLNGAAINQFKSLATGLGRTQESSMAEALNLLFAKSGEPEIA